ncbi:MAG TPA: acyloxyacyl hydrolase [Chthoniobacteraceae bacterium]|nr:acyloxyacyl hydrolase [Chthoniobacteraceae bacterium]
MIVSLLPAAAFAAVFLTLQPASFAGKEMKSVLEARSPFDQGARELQIGLGGFTSVGNYSEVRPHTTDVDASVRLGWMLTSPAGEGALRGNLEFLTEIVGGGVVDGPSGGMAGLSLLLRYNFVQPDAHWVPYFQIGAGALYNNIHENEPQRLIGGPFEFNLQAGLGLRYLFSDECAMFVEADYRHISNACLYDRNAGMNSVGGWLGVSLFF